MSVTLPAETCMQVPPLCNAATENWRRLALRKQEQQVPRCFILWCRRRIGGHFLYNTRNLQGPRHAGAGLAAQLSVKEQASLNTRFQV